MTVERHEIGHQCHRLRGGDAKAVVEPKHGEKAAILRIVELLDEEPQAAIAPDDEGVGIIAVERTSNGCLGAAAKRPEHDGEMLVPPALAAIEAGVVEVPGAGALNPEKHIYEEIYFVVEGRGSTEVWLDGEAKRHVFEWQKGSLFSIPVNAMHRIVNAGSAPALLLAGTTAPNLMNLINNAGIFF